MNFFSWIRANIFVILIGVVQVVTTIVAIHLAFQPPVDGNIASATGLSTMLKLFIALSAVCLWFVFLRISDAVAGIKFKESYAQIESNAVALSVYFGLRSLGVGVLLGMLLG